jgi:hypothetical protein
MKKIFFAFIVTFGLIASAYARQSMLIKPGAVLDWEASTGDHGVMKVGMISGQYFEIDQTNDNNRGAGAQKLYGAILDRGNKIVLMNVGNWKEVWEGTLFDDSISGNITAGTSNYTFTISAGARRGRSSSAPFFSGDRDQASTAPFLPGRILRWQTNAMGGQKGNFRVTGVNGNTFTVEQMNDKNVGAGIVKMEGEVKNGKIYLYNRRWDETWIGIATNGTVSGKINNNYTFRIME